MNIIFEDLKLSKDNQLLIINEFNKKNNGIRNNTLFYIQFLQRI